MVLELDHVPSGRKILQTTAGRLVVSVLSENVFNPLHHIPTEWRRNFYATVSQLPFPCVFSDDSSKVPASLEKAEELSKQGHGIGVVTRHFSKGDLLMLMGFLRRRTSLTDNREINVPLAYHEYTPAKRAFLKYWGVTPLSVVTQETVEKERNFDASGRELRLGEGTTHYAKVARHTLNSGGLVFFAPSATRTPQYEPWKGRPIEMLAKLVGDKVAFINVGLDLEDLVQNPKVLSYEAYNGYNLRKKYIVTAGELYTKQELLERASKAGVTIDRFMADEMAQLIHPKFLVPSYREELGRRRLEEVFKIIVSEYVNQHHKN